MEYAVQQSTTVTLRFGQAEASWLKAVVQNPLGENEEPYTRQMREVFWNALADVKP